MNYRNRKEILLSFAGFFSVFCFIGYMFIEPFTMLKMLVRNPGVIQEETVFMLTVLNSMILLSGIAYLVIMNAGDIAARGVVTLYRKIEGEASHE